jgi:hypothetical protein
MAEMQIKIAADVSSAVSGLDKLSNELDQTGKDAVQLGNAVENASQKIRALPNVTGQATSTLTNFSRVVQDAPFGLIGIANNIDPLISSFQQLKASTGTTGGAFKALVGQLAGPAGIALAISTVTSLLITFGDRLFDTGKAAEKVKSDADQLKDAISGIFSETAKEATAVTTLVAVLQNEAETRERKLGALKELKNIQPDIFNGLKLEGEAVVGLDTAYQNYLNNLRNVIAVKIKQAQLDQLIEKQLKQQGVTLVGNEKLLVEGTKRLQESLKNDPRLGPNAGRVLKFYQDQENASKKAATQLQSDIDNLINDLTELSKGVKISGATTTKNKLNFDFELIPGISNLSEFEAKLAGPLPGLLPDLQKAIKNIQKDPKDVQVPVRPKLKPIGTDAAVLEFSNNLTQALQNALQSGLEGIGESIGNLLSGENFGEGILNVISSLLTAIGKALVAYGIAKEGIDKILGPGGIAIPGAAAIGIGVATIAAASLLKNFGGARAEGGPVSGNKTYLVGERGPELFVPNVAGTIVPNDELPSFGQGLASVLGGRGGGGTTLRGQDIILAYARTQRSQLRVNG